MPNQTNASVAATLSGGLTNDVAISPDGSTIYAAGNDGYLRVYNALTGELENTWHVGTQLGGIDISPDGSFLMATELTPLATRYSDNWTTNETDTVTYKVDFASGQVTSYAVTVTADEYVFNDVAVLADGKVLLSEQELPGWSGWVPAWTLDPSTGTYAKVTSGSIHRMADFVSASDDGTCALFGENDISDASLSMYRSGSGFVATHELYADGVSGFNSGVQAISGEAGLVAQYVPGNGLHIYNLNLQYQQNLASHYSQLTSDSIAGLAFDSTGHNLYVLDSTTDSIMEISTSDWSLVQTIAIGADIQADGSRFADSLLVSPDSNYFTILSGSSVLEVGNPAVPTVVSGTSGDDHLTGTIFGHDTFVGAGGNDTFSDTAAGLNGDTIADFGAGDRIVISDANLADFNFSLSGNTLTYTGGSLTLSSVPSGTIVAGAAADGGVKLTIAEMIVGHAGDFNGDGKADILWREDAGTITDWLGQANGGFSANWANSAATLATDWHVVGIGDFNGDHRDDVLWRSDSGQTTDWLGTANGGFSDNGANSAVNVSADWKVAGTGDFNGDGKDDILWRNDRGLTVDWLGTANGGFSDNYASSAVNVPTSWRVSGTGDFNGDGKDDILWRDSTTGLTVDWLGTASGGFSDNYANSAVNVPTDWQVVGTGDFNGDHRDDILWRNDSGLVTEWLGQANGGFSSNWARVAVNVPTDWKVVSIGDFNGDHRDDILWRSDSGQTTDWLGTWGGGFTDNYAHAATFVPTSWHVQAEAFF